MNETDNKRHWTISIDIIIIESDIIPNYIIPIVDRHLKNKLRGDGYIFGQAGVNARSKYIFSASYY